MTKAIATYISGIMVHNGICPKEKERVLNYGFELMVTSIIGVLLMIIVSLIMMKPMGWLFFLVGFAPLRTKAGGYHASTHHGCYFISTLVYTLCLIIANFIDIDRMVILGISLIAVIIIVAFSPVQAVNKPMKEEKRKKNRRISLAIVSFEFIVAAIICYLNIENKMVNLFYLGIFVASISLVVSKIKNIFTGGKENG